MAGGGMVGAEIDVDFGLEADMYTDDGVALDDLSFSPLV